MQYSIPIFLTNDQRLRKNIETLFKVARDKKSILVYGETGVGKELIAKLINSHSGSSRNFVPINCAAIPHNLAESVLFGHEKGAFSGALARQIGKFELAHEGDIFLDEISTLPYEIQMKLLRILEESEVDRIGAAEPIKINVRVISATNEDLSELVIQNRFRQDLYYRISGYKLHIPPLRERICDIELLSNYFVHTLNQANNRKKHLDSKTLDCLSRYSWPGNVRELKNVIENAYLLSDSNKIYSNHLIFYGVKQSPSQIRDRRSFRELSKITTDFQKEWIQDELAKNKWNKDKTSKILGISRNQLYRKMTALGIE